MSLLVVKQCLGFFVLKPIFAMFVVQQKNKVRVPSKDLKKNIMALKEMRKKMKLKKYAESKVASVSTDTKKKIVLKKKPEKIVRTKKKTIVVKKKKRKFFPSARVAPEFDS